MRNIRDVLRLHAEHMAKRQIAISLNIGRTAVGDYIARATRAGLSWPLPEDLSEAAGPASVSAAGHRYSGSAACSLSVLHGGSLSGPRYQ